MKECSKCGEEKELSEFYKQNGRGDGLRSHCKTCIKEYYAINKEVIGIKKVEYYLVNREVIAVQKAEHYQVNREIITARVAAYFKTPRGRLASKNAWNKRRALIKGGSVTIDELQQLTDSTHNCFYCNLIVTDDNRHIDHFIPLSKGGLHDLDNLVISCSSCNLMKHAKMPDVFIATLSEEDQERIISKLEQRKWMA